MIIKLLMFDNIKSSVEKLCHKTVKDIQKEKRR